MFFSNIFDTSFVYTKNQTVKTINDTITPNIDIAEYCQNNFVGIRQLVQNNFIYSFFKHGFENNSENQCNNDNEVKTLNNNSIDHVFARECTSMEILQLIHAFFYFENEIVNNKKNGIISGDCEINIDPSVESNIYFEAKNKTLDETENNDSNVRKKVKFEVDVTGHCKKSLNRIKIDFSADLKEDLFVDDNQWLRKKIELSISKQKNITNFFWNEISWCVLKPSLIFVGILG